MSEPKLVKAAYGSTVQAFPLTSGTKSNLTSGTFTDVTLIHCAADGVIGVVFSDSGSTISFTLESGNDFSFPGGATVTITSGTYHIA